MMLFKLTCCSIFILIALSSFGQNTKGKMSIELSIPHSSEVARISSCSYRHEVFVIIHNGTDSVNYFYEDWNSYGYYNLSFEIKFKDSIYQVVSSQKLWYRNSPSYHIVKPNESLVFPHSLIDTACVNSLSYHQFFKDGWVGFPPNSKTDTLEIRVVYQLCDPEDMIAEDGIRLLNYKREEYTDYLDGDIESDEAKPVKEKLIPKNGKSKPVQETPKPKLPKPKPIIIFNEPLISEWQKVIIY